MTEPEPEPEPESKSEPIQISDAEWVVMRALWKLREATAGEIIAELSHSDWKPKTIQTLVRRLVQKGAIDFDQPTRDRIYRAAIDEATCKLQASESFLGRVFEGRLAPFLANFAGQKEKLSAEDIAELKKLLEDKP